MDQIVRDPGRMCFRKRAHLSLRSAKDSARRKGKRYKTKLRAYQCPICSFWHLTTKPLVKPAEKTVTVPAKPQAEAPKVLQPVSAKCPALKLKIFSSEEEVSREVALLQSQGKARASFHCMSCGMWHITNKIKEADPS